MKSLITLCALVLFLLSTDAATAQSERENVLDIAQIEAGPVDVRAHASRWRTTQNDLQVDPARAAWQAGDFEQPDPDQRGLGITSDAIWYHLSLVADSTTDKPLVLDMGTYFVAEGRVVLVEGDQENTLLIESDRQPLYERLVPRARLQTPVFAIQPGTQAELFVGVAVDGSADLNIRLMSPADLRAETEVRATLATAFYLAAAVIAFFMIVFLWVSFSWAQFFYFAFFVILVLYVAQLNGILFALIWPGAPFWNGYASHFIGVAGIMCAAAGTLVFIQSQHPTSIFKGAVTLFLVFGVSFMLAPLFLSLVTIKQTIGLLMLAFLLLQIWGGVLAVYHRLDGGLIFAIGTLLLFVYLGLFTLGSQIDGIIGAPLRLLTLQFGPLVEGVVFFASVMRQAFALKKRDASHRQEINALNASLQAMRHDLRQPLGAMRASLERFSQTGEPDPKDDRLAGLRQSIDYLEGVIDEDNTLTGSQADPEANAAEVAPGQLYLTAVEHMFRTEAEQKGIALKTIPTSLRVAAASLPLLRILSNLVSNSIEHSKGDRIIVGLRRHADGSASFQVADNGIGYAEPQVGATPLEAIGPREKGNGLKIVQSLAAASDLQVHVPTSRVGLTVTSVRTLPVPHGDVTSWSSRTEAALPSI